MGHVGGKSHHRPDAIEVLGAGLTCDAYHPASPDPEGLGALGAMEGALGDAGMTPSDIDYVNFMAPAPSIMMCRSQGLQWSV